MTVNRRTFLTSTVGVVAGIGLAGCIGGQTDGDSATETPTEPETTTGGSPPATETETTETEQQGSIDHPAAAGVTDEPTLGPPIEEAEAGIIMFSDPSCPYCQEFHEKTYPELKEKLIDPGAISYVYRTYPKVDPWGEEAIHALESVYRRDEALFWDLKHHYYENPGQSVLTERTTRTFLEENGDVDVDEVVDDMNQRTYSDAVDEDMNAAREADMTTIPSYAIVNDGEVRTTAHGVSSYQNIKTMLGV